MKISLILTIHNRSAEVSRQVADSFREPGNRPDEVIVVLDRATAEAKDGARSAWEGYEAPVRFITIPGEPVWKSPVKAWNFGFAAATGDVLYCASSETVQAPWNVEHVRRFLSVGNDAPVISGVEPPSTILPICIHGKAECSCGPGGQEVNWGPGTPGNLLCDSRHPRPLGFIWAAPAAAIKQMGGYDEKFDQGLWYDDNDFFMRMWQTGLDFLFTDEVVGTHLHHERPGLNAEAINRNLAYIMSKYGGVPDFNKLPRIEEFTQTSTRWSHL